MTAALSPLEIFRAKGIPHRKMEDWKYSDLRSVLEAGTVARDKGVQWRITNTPSGVERHSIGSEELPNWADDLFKRHQSASPMDAAALAFVSHGVALRVPKGVRTSEPIHLDLRSDGQAQVVFLLEAGASATLVESHYSDGRDLRNLSALILLEAGAHLTHIRQSPFANELVIIETISIHQERNSAYSAHFMNGGARLSRIDMNIVLAGEGAEANLSGVSVLGDTAHADITTRIDHKVGNTTSRQLFKMVAGGHSRAIYQGKIVVHEGANGSDSRQTAKALLLGTRAEADLKPELEIFADDVKCAHGAAAGDLDADSLFYLRARGIPEGEARGMLIEAFLQEVVDGIDDEAMRASAAEFIADGLARAMVEAP